MYIMPCLLRHATIQAGEVHYILTLELRAIKVHVLIEARALTGIPKPHNKCASFILPPASALINVSQGLL